jgi:hypothetical protein
MPFRAWDGEGVKGENGYHPYSLFGSSDGWRIKAFDLTTLDCLELMMETELAQPNAIDFGFAFGYDTNMILKDLPLPQLASLKQYTRTRFQGYRIEYIPRKWLEVSYGRKGHRTTIRLFDVFSFFNAGLGKVLREYNIGSVEQLARIDAGKGERPDFQYNDITTDIEPYWETELVLMVRLMDKFRATLQSAGIHITSWHGPGAIANYLLRKHDVQQLMDRGITDEIAAAGRLAYFGGRFEGFYAGYYEGDVWSADINSAYPYSHSRLPDLRNGKWRHELGRGNHPGDIRLGLYNIRYHRRPERQAMPLPHRDPDGTVSFPSVTEGWFHAAEAAMVYNDPHAEILESYIFEDDGSYPFAWIEEIYNQRLRIRAEQGDIPSRPLKLGPNSLYGQVAQRAGWERVNGPPKWHQLEWAGAITSECRSMVYAVGRKSGRSLVSLDTDGVIATNSFGILPNGEGTGLGQWKVTKYTGILYVQNGIYWLRDSDGKWLPPKSRGIPRKKLEFATVFPVISRNENLTINQHMFTGFGTALRGRMNHWRKWEDVPRTIEFGGGAKSRHSVRNCLLCRQGRGWTAGLHPLFPVPPKQIESSPHRIPWLDSEDYPARREIIESERWGIFE